MNVIKPIRVTGYAAHTRATTGTYFDKAKVMQTAAVNAPRYNWDPETGAFGGVLIEPARTNLLLNSASLATQTRAVSPGSIYTLTFYGTGSVSLSGAAASTLMGTAAYPQKRAQLTFAASSSSVTLSVLGTVQCAQLEQGGFATSYIPTAGATVTRAADLIDGSGLFSSTFPQPVADWSAAATYNTGDVAGRYGRLYESLTDGNIGTDPAVSPAPAPSTWLDTGPSNVFACLDETVSTPSTGPGPSQAFAIKSPLDAVTACALLAVMGTKAHVAISNGLGSVTSQSTTSIAGTTGNLASVMTGFAAGNIVSVCIEGPSISIGEFLFGTFHELGSTAYGHRFSITDYSRKDTNEFGKTKFVRKPSAKRMAASVMVPKSNYNNVILLLEAITATPTVWIASDDPQYSAGAIIYGNCAEFDLEIAYPTENLMGIEIQGLI